MTTEIKQYIKQKGKPVIIPGASRDDLPGFFIEMGFKKGAEIGVYKGELTKKFCDSGLFVFAVDPWKAYGNHANSPDKIKSLQKRQDFLYGHTNRHLEKHINLGNCKIIRKTSMEAVDQFEDGSLDFVYIDGNHSFRYIAEDLCEWSKKVRSGGIISGHDYTVNKKPPRDPDVIQVKYVLHAFVDAFGIESFFVLGSNHPKGKRIFNPQGAYWDIYIDGENEEKRDRWRSWFWIKK